jgi:YidC/Oxa1 family membrane protein insertase
MKSDNKNLILAVTLSMLILVLYQLYFTPPPPTAEQIAAQQNTGQNAGQTLAADGSPVSSISAEAMQSTKAIVDIINAPRIAIENSKVIGSISLAGGRIDDLRLKSFQVENDPSSHDVSLLRRTGTENAYFAESFFTSVTDAGYNRAVDRAAIWQADGSVLSPDTPVTLSHEADGVIYKLTYSIDDAYMISVASSVENISDRVQQLGSSTRILRQRPSYTEWISYAGPMGYFNSDSGNVFLDFEDVSGTISCASDERFCAGNDTSSWIGVSDKNWLTAIISTPDQQTDYIMRPVNAPNFETIRLQLDDQTRADIDQIQTGNLYEGSGQPIEASSNQKPVQLAQGETASWTTDLFLGPKKYTVLNDYQDSKSIPRFTNAIDWGWFEFLAKPMLIVIVWLNEYVNNFGIAIILLTVGIKILFFPLANKSYKSMAKMRELAPQVKDLRERFGDDRQRQQQEMMALYRKEKVNPASGCLPILLQIPVFFALYKVLYVTIEMRHAPFFGWVTDLSAVDPTSIINLFGLLPYDTAFAPDILNIGIWPILMGVTMFIQMSLNPPPPDPIQAKIFKYMPVMFTFLLATFPAGLVVYWTWNNILTIAQQWYIMRGVRLEKQARG